MKESRFQTEWKMVHRLNPWEEKSELLQNCVCLFSFKTKYRLFAMSIVQMCRSRVGWIHNCVFAKPVTKEIHGTQRAGILVQSGYGQRKGSEARREPINKMEVEDSKDWDFLFSPYLDLFGK